MLNQSENEILTRVGPGTPMGDLLRRFWIPALLSIELPKPNCDPVRVRLLGDNFVAWRDADGKVAIFDEYCPHRGASLALARCEGDGLRCLYHGWKFASDGEILDTPNFVGDNIKKNLRATVFPSIEAGEIVWTYIGPKDKKPSFPEYPFMSVGPSHRVVRRTMLHCNWVQAMEGHLDSSHAGILHDDWDPFGRGTSGQYMQLVRDDTGLSTDDDAPIIEVEDRSFGFHMAAIRNARQNGNSVKYARIHAFVMPWLSLIPPRGYAFEVPVDDTTVSVVSASWDPVKEIVRENIMKIFGSPKMYEHSGDNLVRRFTGTAENRWHQDRERMRRENSFSGIDGFSAEDFSVCSSMGPIFDRTKEHLVTSDAGIIRMRRMLLQAAKDLRQGIEPATITTDDTLKIRAADSVLADGQKWQELVDTRQ